MITVGIDEVGRGCWAGPLVAGAVVLARPIPGLKDSKKLSKLQREKLAAIIHAEAIAVGLGWVWPADIDTGGITAAVKSAMQQALAAIDCAYDEIIVDGNINYFAADPKARAVIKADDLFPSVSAASIVAKVARDNYMVEIAEQYPGYGFEQHVGYGTTAHIAGQKSLGVTDIHRKSYKPIRALLGVAA
jgi:ribonuclease HII